VIPIYKAGQEDVPANYRPIATLEFLSKVYEKTIFNKMVKFFTKFNIIRKQQYGFGQGLSTGDALLRYTDSVYDSLENSRYMMSVFFRFFQS
jgi:hypothetical protein